MRVVNLARHSGGDVGLAPTGMAFQREEKKTRQADALEMRIEMQKKRRNERFLIRELALGREKGGEKKPVVWRRVSQRSAHRRSNASECSSLTQIQKKRGKNAEDEKDSANAEGLGVHRHTKECSDV